VSRVEWWPRRAASSAAGTRTKFPLSKRGTSMGEVRAVQYLSPVLGALWIAPPKG
jgi:hypothetical protein